MDSLQVFDSERTTLHSSRRRMKDAALAMKHLAINQTGVINPYHGERLQKWIRDRHVEIVDSIRRPTFPLWILSKRYTQTKTSWRNARLVVSAKVLTVSFIAHTARKQGWSFPCQRRARKENGSYPYFFSLQYPLRKDVEEASIISYKRSYYFTVGAIGNVHQDSLRISKGTEFAALRAWKYLGLSTKRPICCLPPHCLSYQPINHRTYKIINLRNPRMLSVWTLNLEYKNCTQASWTIERTFKKWGARVIEMLHVLVSWNA